MSFLAPLFLFGAAAIALPVLFHLIRRNARERVPFSSLMFLLPSPPRVTRRSRLENLLLLLLRCAVIAFLAFAFARPFFSTPVAPDLAGRAGQKLLMLVDTSASMRRAGVWEAARARVRSILSEVSPADQVACFAFDRDLRALVSFDQWTAMPASERVQMVQQRLDKLTPGWGATHLGTALITASEMFESPALDEERPRRIVLITDLQEGSRLDGLQGFEWPKGVEVQVERVPAQRTTNAGLQLASDREPASQGSTNAARVRVTNASDSKREQFQVGWRHAGQQGFVGPSLDTYIPPGQSRVITAPEPASEPTPDQLVLVGDDDDFDNTVFVIPPRTMRTKILALGADRDADPAQSLFYLRRAFQETRNLAAEVVRLSSEAVLGEGGLAETSLVIVTGSLPEHQSRAVKSYLEQGKAALVAMTSMAVAKTVADLVGQSGFAADEVTGDRYAMLSQIDFEHPLFSPFADPRYSDFTKIHFWKHRRISVDSLPEARVLARFDNGDVALAEVPVGKGKLWILTSSWQPQDSQLALSSKFVPLLYAALEQSGGMPEYKSQYWVGEAVSLPPGSNAVTIRGPNASEVTLSQDARFTQTAQPGIYTISSMQPPLSFAVNVPPEESKTAPLLLEDLERLGLPLQQQLRSSTEQTQRRKEHLQATQLESRQKLWRWLIVAALVVLVTETWLAGRLTRPTVQSAEAAPAGG